MEHIGQTDVADDVALEDELVNWEWQDGVLSAVRPAERARCRSGRGGNEKRSWWVWTKSDARYFHRSWE